MSNGVNYLHSHSGLERELNFPKDVVLVDEKYRDMFPEDMRKLFIYKRREYYKVNIAYFVRKGGQFKNLHD